MRRPALFALCAPRFVFAVIVMLLAAGSIAQTIEDGEGRLLPAQVAPQQQPAYAQPVPPAPIQVAPAAAPPATPAGAPDVRIPPGIEEPAPMNSRAADLPVAGEAMPAPPVTGSPILLILEFRSTTLPREEVEALTQALWAQLNVTGAVRLLPRHETRQWLIANDLYPYLPYGPFVPMHMVARKGGANFVVTGTIDRVDQSYAVELLVYSAAGEAPVMKNAGARVADLNQMLQRMGSVAAEVVAGLEKELGRALGGMKAPAARREASVRPAQREVKAATETSKVKVAAASHKPLIEPDEALPKAAPPAEENQAAAKPQAAPKELIVAKAEPVAPRGDEAPRASEAIAAKRVEIPAATPAPVATPAPTPKPAATPKPTPEPAAAKPVVTPEAAAPAATKAEPIFQETVKLPIGDDKRLEKLKQAAALDPKNAVYSQQLGFDYYYRKEFEKCVELCDKALANAPENSQLLLVKGSALISLKKWEAAVKAYEASIAADASNNYARYNLALGLEQMKSPKAAAAWKDYLEKAKTDPDPEHRELMADATARLAKLETQR